ncbi:arrestin domain-containing protein 1b [Astyanax mexicanus]|uniref:Arrestin domain-containing protein 1 n=1 Tax=Astyanax mexicanus TaxID=7994 RepID=A0A8B9HDH4_ASTMX|nr:arrestin domain-containing protein 1b [Astyanax mexicanus]KAG9266241.1 arrestin domain-containing protein 1 [Astyanax mexicanus]
MGKLQEFSIAFTSNKLVYSPGETLSGSVRLTTDRALHYKAIKVNCVGSCGISSKMNDTSWMAEEQYVSSMLSVADKGTLPPGEHNFPFQFLIPEHAPTSFEGPFGKIVYRIRAVIDTPRFSKDYKTQRPFYLLNMLNLNEVPDIEQPSCAVTTKKFTYLLVKTGTLMLKARSDLRGYTPGQIIKLSTEIHNKSGKDTGCVIASLIQKVTYKTKRPMFDLRTIAEVEGAGVKAGKHAEWREQIIVPPLPQSGLTGCSLIDIDYFIQVSLKSPETVVTLPIYIGNIAVNLTPSRPPPPNPLPHTPLPPMQSLSPGPVVPSAPPAEDELEGEQGAGGLASEEIPTKSHSQQDPSGQAPTMSPSAFSHAPSQALPQGQHPQSADSSAPLFCVSTGATIPFFADSNTTPVPTTCPLILPPEYSSWEYPHEPPPTYEESCSSNNSSFNTSMT